ncbi:sigma-70 domain-containing protein [Tetzosporium hominis]|uniref:sigma-70 domain-containing protein n=1 Tax=Tetzosporium hominis TaxID=2020506 RepID=UPI0013FD7419|nr:sigma-70 domain-containing protein [Tetzosporium hominis]
MIREQFIREHNQEPTIKEIAAQLNKKEEDVLYALEALYEPMSLHEPLHQDVGESVYFLNQLKDSSTSEDLWTTLRE